MLQIDLINVQAISEAHIQIQDNTICEFIGDNSNGKSIVSKIIEKLVSGDLKEPSIRSALIKDGAEQAAVLFTANNRQLGLILKRETRDCLIMLKPDMSNPDKVIFRQLNDKAGYDAIVRQFGFRAYAQGDICLQLSPTFGAIPFVTTNGTVNAEIEKEITVDKIADEFLKTFKTITFPAFKSSLSQLKSKRENYRTMLENLESYDWRTYDSLYVRMSEVYQAIRTYKYIELEPIEVPDLDIVALEPIQLQPIPIVEFYNLVGELQPIGKELDDYIKIMEGVCPTCGRPINDHVNGEL